MKGYRKEEVDEMIVQLQETIRQKGYKIDVLEEKLARLKEALTEKDAIIERISQELARLGHRTETLEGKIGELERCVLEAYGNPSDSRKDQDDLLNQIMNQTQCVEERAGQALSDFSEMRTEMQAVYEKFLHRTTELEDQIRELNYQARIIPQFYLDYGRNRPNSASGKAGESSFNSKPGRYLKDGPIQGKASFSASPMEKGKGGPIPAHSQMTQDEVPDSEVLKEYIRSFNNGK